jgi:hypothetical protein
MQRVLGCCFISLAITGCPDADDPATEDDTGSSTGSDSGSPTSTPPATTVPGDDGDDGSASASATGSSTGEPPATGDDTGPTTGDDGSDSGTGSESSSGGGEEAGVCVAACREDADCCPFGAIGCPGEDYPNNWTCVEGACQFGGCSETADCTSIIPIGDPECIAVSGVGVCAEACEKDGDCPPASGTECIGVADDGSMYCTTPVDPCENDDDCEGSGTCDVDSGACVCTSAEDCTDPELGACSVSG